MRRPPFVLIALAIWLVTEFLAFTVVVHFAGLMGALLLGLLTSLAGISVLRGVGRGAIVHLRAALEGRNLPNGKMLDGLLTAVGAVLLILPGFVTDLVGMALAAPSLRQFLAKRLGGTIGRSKTISADQIDLSPEDWSTLENPKT